VSRPEDTLQVYQEAKHAGLLGKNASNTDWTAEDQRRVDESNKRYLAEHPLKQGRTFCRGLDVFM
jgi:hypothetical protein